MKTTYHKGQGQPARLKQFASVSNPKWAYDQTRVRSLATLVSDSIIKSCLVDFIDVTLAREDTNSKLVYIVTVTNVDDEDRVGNILLQIWTLRFGKKAKLLFIL